MNRPLQYFNLFGVVALATLCVSQWQTNRRVNLEAGRLEKTRLEQSTKLAEQEKSINGCASDLESFRERLVRANIALNETETRLAVAEREGRQLAAERHQLKASVTNWAAAVAARDERLKVANDQIQKFAADRNDAVAKFNALADKYNVVVKDLNEARAMLASTRSNTAAPKK